MSYGLTKGDGIMFSNYQKEILTGLLLGDGCLCKSKKAKNCNAQLSICRSIKDKEYLLWTAQIFENYLNPRSICERSVYDKRTKKTYDRIVLRTKSHRDFEEFYKKWYKNGKEIPNDLLLTNTIVGVWFADDGCISAPKDKLNKLRFDIKFATHSFSKESVARLKTLLDGLYGIELKICPEKNLKDEVQYTIRGWKTEDCRRFLKKLDEEFPPLKRKSDIWNNPAYRLWEEISALPNCPYCKKSDVYKNGKAVNLHQKYLCKTCRRQWTLK